MNRKLILTGITPIVIVVAIASLTIRSGRAARHKRWIANHLPIGSQIPITHV